MTYLAEKSSTRIKEKKGNDISPRLVRFDQLRETFIDKFTLFDHLEEWLLDEEEERQMGHELWPLTLMK